MSATTFFQIFIFFDVFLMGVLSALALQHARAHYRPKQPATGQRSHPSAATNEPLPAADRERLLQASQEQFKAVLKNSADLLQHDLKITAEQIDNLVNRLATEIVSVELESYRTQLAQLKKQAEADLGGVKQEVIGHEAEIKAKMEQEMQAEKLKLVKQIDTKLGDAVASFLLETLQHNVDLGSQSSYLLALLEEHKADFKREVSDDAPAAK